MAGWRRLSAGEGRRRGGAAAAAAGGGTKAGAGEQPWTLVSYATI
jgi:hypothetical protein